MKIKKLFLAAGLSALAVGVTAQSPVDGSHYRAGQGGNRGGTLPEPGIYLRDDNWFYTGTAETLPGYKTFVYVQAPQLLWVTDWKILGAKWGMDFEIPFAYREASHRSPVASPGGGYPIGGLVSDHQSGLGDVKLEPLLLSWHWKHFDTTVGYALLAPTGEFSERSAVNLGDDAWSHLISLGGVWYPDAKKSWAVSLLHHYEFNSSQVGTLAQSGSSPGSGYPSTAYPKISCSTYTLEWAVSKTILTNTEVGLFGYYQKQFTDSSPAVNVFQDSEVAGVGPEISFRLPRWDLSMSLRYAYEFTAYHRPQGHAFNLTLSKKF